MQAAGSALPRILAVWFSQVTAPPERRKQWFHMLGTEACGGCGVVPTVHAVVEGGPNPGQQVMGQDSAGRTWGLGQHVPPPQQRAVTQRAVKLQVSGWCAGSSDNLLSGSCCCSGWV